MVLPLWHKRAKKIIEKCNISVFNETMTQLFKILRSYCEQSFFITYHQAEGYEHLPMEALLTMLPDFS